jgi:UDP-galactopyranose mutase
MNNSQNRRYNYLIVGTGLFGSVFAHEAKERGKKCLVIEKRDHIGGNCYTEKINGIDVHYYGAHIFHTSDKAIWEYANRFASFNNFINSPIANYKDELYNLPFNMNTFVRLWPDVRTPEQARKRIDEQKAHYSGIGQPSNLEEQALLMCGKDIYEKLIKGYTEKQWGRKCKDLPSFIIRRIPLRFTFDNNYFNDFYQGIPEGGYTALFEKMLEGTEVKTGVDFLENRNHWLSIADKVVYTGPIDAFYDYRFGNLEFRSLRFDHKILEGTQDFQGNAVINYTDAEIPFTRIIEHKHFEFGTQPDTVITYEYPQEWAKGSEPFYPVNDEKNQALYEKYKGLAKLENDVIFGGRLAEYKYYDMDKVIGHALEVSSAVLQNG